MDGQCRSVLSFFHDTNLGHFFQVFNKNDVAIVH